jgi:hypothetical protein
MSSITRPHSSCSGVSTAKTSKECVEAWSTISFKPDRSLDACLQPDSASAPAHCNRRPTSSTEHKGNVVLASRAHLLAQLLVSVHIQAHTGVGKVTEPSHEAQGGPELGALEGSSWPKIPEYTMQRGVLQILCAWDVELHTPSVILIRTTGSRYLTESHARNPLAVVCGR